MRFRKIIIGNVFFEDVAMPNFFGSEAGWFVLASVVPFISYFNVGNATSSANVVCSTLISEMIGITASRFPA